MRARLLGENFTFTLIYSGLPSSIARRVSRRTRIKIILSDRLPQPGGGEPPKNRRGRPVAALRGIECQTLATKNEKWATLLLAPAAAAPLAGTPPSPPASSGYATARFRRLRAVGARFQGRHHPRGLAVGGSGRKRLREAAAGVVEVQAFGAGAGAGGEGRAGWTGTISWGACRLAWLR